MEPTRFLALAFALSACEPRIFSSDQVAEAENQDALIIRTYDVPAGREASVSSVLNRMFWRCQECPAAGHADEGPAGMVVVAAPESVHSELEGVIAAFSKAGAETSRNIRISYWVVAGTRADRSDLAALPPAITEAMGAVAAAETPMTYAVRSEESLLSMDGEHARASGGEFTISQSASATPGGHIVAQVDVEYRHGAGTSTRIQLAAGQVLVMGKTGPSEEADADALFYVLRPEFVPAG